MNWNKQFKARRKHKFPLCRGLVEIAPGRARMELCLGCEKVSKPSSFVIFRDYYGSMCPDGFIASSTEMWQCVPMTDYEGPCSEEPANFDGFTVRALDRWSQKCKAFWPCLDVTFRDLEMDMEAVSFPLSLVATASRLS